MSEIDSVSSVGESPSGTEEYSVNLGNGSLTISVSANATATSEADGESSAESTPEEQSTKDMEGAESDYSSQVPGGPGDDEEDAADVWGETGEPDDLDIEEMEESIADGLIAIEELQPGFIEDVMAQIEGAESGENTEADADDTTQGESASEGEESTEDENVTDVEDDTTQGDDEAQEGDAEDRWNEDLMTSLEDLAARLEEIIGMLGGGATENPDATEGKPYTDPMDVAEGMAEELGDGEAPEEAEGNPVDTFLEIFDQMSPDAQNEVVQILASGIFGQQGVEAAEAVKDDATGEIDNSKVVDEVDA